MAVTLAGYVGLRVALTILARPRFLPARTLTYPVAGDGLEPNQYTGDWVRAQGIRNAAGQLVMPHAEAICPPNAGAGCGQFPAGMYNWELYQPDSRFWLFQGIETGIYVVLALLLVYLAVRRIRRIA